MHQKLIQASFTVVLLSASLGLAATRANFSGTWVMDKNRSEGLPSNTEQTMTITQADDNLTLENKIVTAAAEIRIRDTFILNGKQVEFTEKRNDQDVKGTRTSRWLPDGSGFESQEELTNEGGDGLPVYQQITRKWVMSADGKMFTVELTARWPDRSQHTKRTFVKK